ncbi:MAG: hypothetical protein HRT89_09050 [Lentisphaeria bacterium]|nr:hypothetical protein [Lentisphaeria bacterium]NQZ68205.1 hypothetical protein [Lentisphaeria bacterium]
MKNQYFGDINDYYKYSLLQKIGENYEITIAWWLTDDDGSTDGRKTDYVNNPALRELSPTIFDFMKSCVENNIREVSVIENTNLINARYYSPLITDDKNQRQVYMDDLMAFAEGTKLIFVDPDNGMEIKSTRKGNKNSSKFIYLDEIKRIYDAGFKLLIYQHFPRENHQDFMDRKCKELEEYLIAEVTPTKFEHVVFFLIA